MPVLFVRFVAGFGLGGERDFGRFRGAGRGPGVLNCEGGLGQTENSYREVAPRRHEGWWARRVGFCVAMTCALLVGGCRSRVDLKKLPESQQLIRDQLVIHSDFPLPNRHRLLDELVRLRDDLYVELALPGSDEPIHVYLFDDEERYVNYVAEHYPEFPPRRAIFVQSDTTLSVFAYWGHRVGEDLRHETTHGYLHAVVPNLPLWLDEGLAEYFEVGRGKQGLHAEHLQLLAEAFRGRRWSPDLFRLEQLPAATSLAQIDYAESWLWVHFLLQASPETRDVLRRHLAELRKSGTAASPILDLNRIYRDPQTEVIQHLRQLIQSTASAASGSEASDSADFSAAGERIPAAGGLASRGKN